MLKLSIDEKGLLRAIARDFDNDMPRLVYADWLDEQGRSDRAEFIRLQCELAGYSVVPVVHRSRELQIVHRNDWIKELPKWAITEYYHNRFSRGFLSTFAGIPASMFVRYGPQLLDRTPVRYLNLMLGHGVIDELICCPWVHEIPELSFSGSYFTDAQIVELMNGSWLTGSRMLDLSWQELMREPGVRAIAGCRHLRSLEVLDIRHNQHITSEAASYLAKSGYLRNVRLFRISPSDRLSREELRRIFGDRWSG